MIKILILSTYPISNPVHGGQRRAKALYEHYKSLLGTDNVKYSAVFNPYAYSECSADDIPVGPETLKKISDFNFAEDIICGESIGNDSKVIKKLSNLIDSFKPNVIQFEQGYCFGGFKNFSSEKKLKFKFIYSSHNVEYEMKKDIYESINADQIHKRHFLDRIKEIETDLAQSADYVITVSYQDDKKLAKYISCPSVIVPNGVSSYKVNSDDVRYWRNYMHTRGVSKVLLFVGSAHIPNLQGIEELVLDKIGFLKPDTRLFVVGGVCELIKQQFSRSTIRDVVYDLRVELLGRLSDDRLNALIDVSDIILLPIKQGGGSNLKTAEAILSGKMITATTTAMRSFEEYRSLKRIKIADTPDGFKKAISKQLSVEQIFETDVEKKLSEKVTWSFCLRPLNELIGEIDVK